MYTYNCGQNLSQKCLIQCYNFSNATYFPFLFPFTSIETQTLNILQTLSKHGLQDVDTNLV